MLVAVFTTAGSPPLSFDRRVSFPVCQAIVFPEAIAFTFLFCVKTGGVAFPDLYVPNDILFGPADPCIYIPFSGNLSDLLYFHF
jgi:hypothetical protein